MHETARDPRRRSETSRTRRCRFCLTRWPPSAGECTRVGGARPHRRSGFEHVASALEVVRMYLYGDSTESPLRSNFLEFLRGAMDFVVYMLLAYARISDGKREIVDLERRATEEIARLEGLEDVTASAIAKAKVGAGDSATARCAAELGRVTHAAVESAIAEVRANLA